jgi:menaquinone-dependent protoporphyrinogen oxidase
MTILIAYTSKHGATALIAERIGATLRLRDLDASVLRIADVHQPLRCDAAIVGSPVGPKSLPEAAELAEFRSLLNVRGDATFDGTLDAQNLSLSERMMVKAVRAPYGDYRNWERIDEWAGSIAVALGASAGKPRVQMA